MSEARPACVRTALRSVHAALPEAGATLEAYLDEVEFQCAALSAEDPYRALVLDLHKVMVRVDSGVLADVARIEVARIEADKVSKQLALVQAQERADKRSVWKMLLDPQVLLVLIPLLLGSSGLGGLIVRYFLEGSP